MQLIRKLLIFGLLVGPILPSQAQQNSDHLGDQKLYFGAAYYPETWPEEQIDKDIERMKELNMNVMRMAEFSWSKMEPEEGRYDFEWLHKIIEKLHANGIDVILGTPSAAPPIWMWEKHPEIARTDDMGVKKIHGDRRSTSYTNETYRQKSAEIAERMAREFGNKPGVIGWQTDNEFGYSPDYSEETEKRWHEWLRKKYNSIENLNQLWATDLWSQTYNDFKQIPMPLSHIWHHPSLRFEWARFTNDMIVEFQDLQLAAIRKYSDLPITHDTMPGQRVDYEKLMEDVDYMSVNNYHSWEAYDRIVSNYDRMRGYKKGYYWLFETAPNNSGGGPEGRTWFLHQPDGSMRAALWMNYALGGQGAMYWLWRQQRAGQEMVHGAVISAWGKPAANYDDIKELGEELKKSSDFLMNNPVTPAKIAVIYSHESENGFRTENYVNDLGYYNEWTYRFFLPFQDAYLHRDVIAPSFDLDPYKIVFAPLLPYISDDLRSRMKEWVHQGGTLVLGPMSGYRTGHWTSFTEQALGDIEDWMGITVESRIPIGLEEQEESKEVLLEWNKELGFEPNQALLWSEALSTDKGKILASYKKGMHDGEPAIIENKVGKGKVVFLGTDPGRENLREMFLRYASEQDIEPLASGDKGVVVAPRGTKNQKGKVLVNIMNEQRSISLPKKETYTDILTGEKITGSLRLEPYEVKVLRK
jgi:beta-galactosidase